MTIGTKIRILREVKQFSQENMAQMLNISENSYAKIEKEEVKHTIERLEQIGKVFGMGVVEILTFGENGSFFNNSLHSENGNNILGNGTIVNSTESKILNELTKLRTENKAYEQRTEDLCEQIKHLKEIVALMKPSKSIE